MIAVTVILLLIILSLYGISKLYFSDSCSDGYGFAFDFRIWYRFVMMDLRWRPICWKSNRIQQSTNKVDWSILPLPHTNTLLSDCRGGNMGCRHWACLFACHHFIEGKITSNRSHSLNTLNTTFLSGSENDILKSACVPTLDSLKQNFVGRLHPSLACGQFHSWLHNFYGNGRWMHYWVWM